MTSSGQKTVSGFICPSLDTGPNNKILYIYNGCYAGGTTVIYNFYIQIVPTSKLYLFFTFKSHSCYSPIGEISPTVLGLFPHLTSACVTLCPPQTTERQTPEGSLSMNQSSTSQTNQPPLPNTSTDLDQVLQEAQASLMKSIPELNLSDSNAPAPGQRTSTASESEQDTSVELTLQGRIVHPIH